LPCPSGALSIDTSRGSTAPVRLKRDPECPLHEPIGPAEVIAVGAGGTVAELRAALGPGREPLAGDAVQRRVECPRCGFAEERWGMAAAAACPRCGGTLWPRTTQELAEVPGELRLADLGIPPRDILAVRGAGALTWAELNN
jgi:hypothetical protein